MSEALAPLEQVQLFDQWPDEPQLVERAKEYLHTGKVALKDQPRCLAICAAVVSGVPYRLVMREFQVGFETIKQVYKVFESTGKLRTVKEDLRLGWEEICRLAQWRLKDKLVTDGIPSNVLPMLAGIATDKVRDLTGLEEGLGLPKEAGLEVEEIVVRLRRVKEKLASVDVSSTVSTDISLSANCDDPCAPVTDPVEGSSHGAPRAGEGAEGGGLSSVRVTKCIDASLPGGAEAKELYD